MLYTSYTRCIRYTVYAIRRMVSHICFEYSMSSGTVYSHTKRQHNKYVFFYFSLSLHFNLYVPHSHWRVASNCPLRREIVVCVWTLDNIYLMTNCNCHKYHVLVNFEDFMSSQMHARLFRCHSEKKKREKWKVLIVIILERLNAFVCTNKFIYEFIFRSGTKTFGRVRPVHFHINYFGRKVHFHCNLATAHSNCFEVNFK